MDTGLDNLEKRNPFSRVQHEIAQMLRSNPWMKAHRVEIIEQNAQALSFLLRRSIAQVNNVVVVVGIDEAQNNPPVLETVTTLTATENVVMNRQAEGAATALDVAQAAIEIIDGSEWKFEDFRHEAPEEGVLQAIVTFRGQVTRETTANEDSETES